MVFGSKDPVANMQDVLNQEPIYANSNEVSATATDESEPASSFFKDIDGLEKRLKESTFPNSPYVRVIKADKLGVHNVTFLRPKSIAKATISLLRRWHREQFISELLQAARSKYLK